MQTFKVVRTNPLVKLPSKATVGSAGYDFYAPTSVIINPGERARISLDVRAEVPHGYVLLLEEKSGISLTHGLQRLAGVIDSDYRGVISVIYYNPTNTVVTFEAGAKIIQGILVAAADFPVQEVEELSYTDRNEGGFGSTGAF